MRWLFCIVCLLMGMAGVAQESVEARIGKQIENAQGTLQRTLEENLQQKREHLTELQKARTQKDETQAELAAQEEILKTLESQVRKSEAEWEFWQGRLERTRQLLQDFQVKQKEFQPLSIQELGAFVDDGFDKSLGGHLETGMALDENGVEWHGQFASFGPVRYFRSMDGKLCGVAVRYPNRSLDSVVTKLSDREKAEIETLFRGAVALPPVDLSHGRGFALLTERESLWRHFAKGGLVMFPICLLAVACLVLAMVKVCQLAVLPSTTHLQRVDALVDAALDDKSEEAKTMAEGLPSSLRHLAQTALRHRGEGEEQLEARLYEATLPDQSRLERYLSVLSVSAGTAPLLGLLGTVTGMIHTFKLITLFGTGDARLLSGGISEALITTEAGLMVAIPALLIHAWCVRRTRRNAAICRQAALRLLRLAGKGDGS